MGEERPEEVSEPLTPEQLRSDLEALLGMSVYSVDGLWWHRWQGLVESGFPSRAAAVADLLSRARQRCTRHSAPPESP